MEVDRRTWLCEARLSVIVKVNAVMFAILMHWWASIYCACLCRFDSFSVQHAQMNITMWVNVGYFSLAYRAFTNMILYVHYVKVSPQNCNLAILGESDQIISAAKTNGVEGHCSAIKRYLRVRIFAESVITHRLSSIDWLMRHHTYL